MCHKQDGFNCREVALANVLRLNHVPSRRDMQKHLLALTQDQYPDQVEELQRNMDELHASQWTRSCEAHTSALTYFIEAHWPACIAIQVMKTGQKHVKRLLGQSLMHLALQDRHSPGFLYFSSQHCMSCIQDAQGNWWNIPQNSAHKVSPRVAANLIDKGVGAVVILSTQFVHTHLAAILQNNCGHDPLFAARMAMRMRPIKDLQITMPGQEKAEEAHGPCSRQPRPAR